MSEQINYFKKTKDEYHVITPDPHGVVDNLNKSIPPAPLSNNDVSFASIYNEPETPPQTPPPTLCLVMDVPLSPMTEQPTSPMPEQRYPMIDPPTPMSEPFSPMIEPFSPIYEPLGLMCEPFSPMIEPSDFDSPFINIQDGELSNMLASISSFSRNEKFNSLEKDHSWKEIIIVYKPLQIDNETLEAFPVIKNKIVRAINFYQRILYQLIDCYLDDENIDLEKWNMAIQKNKNFLYSTIKQLGRRIKSDSFPAEVYHTLVNMTKMGAQRSEIDEYCHGVIPRNVINYVITNTRKKLKFDEK